MLYCDGCNRAAIEKERVPNQLETLFDRVQLWKKMDLWGIFKTAVLYLLRIIVLK